MLPLWADVLILSTTPVILLGALWLLGDEHPDGGVEHHQVDEPRDPGEPDLIAAA